MRKPISYSRKTGSGERRPVAGMVSRRSPTAALNTLQMKAQNSGFVSALNHLNTRAAGMIQREVDDSPITHNGTYDNDGNLAHDKSVGVPGWAEDAYNTGAEKTGAPDETPLTHNNTYDEDGNLDYDPSVGVPDWAQEQYKTASKVELIASLSNGKIGSVYFLDGRIRTTHGSGPELDINKVGYGTERYNLDMRIARGIFNNANKTLYRQHFRAISKNKKTKALPKVTRERLAAKEYDRSFKRWLSNQLVNTPTDRLPNWIVPVTRPDEAHDPRVPLPGNLSLFEVYKYVSNGRVMGWHPSRGLAIKYETNKQVVAVLKAGIAHINGVTDLNQRNIMFYDFVKSRAPQFAANIRRPDQV